MNLTKSAIEAMGFTEYPEVDELEICFGIIKVYSLQGLEFEKDCTPKQTKVISFGSNCKAIISQSVNEASKLLIDDIFSDDEEIWRSENNASSPFLLIYFVESGPRTLRGGYRKESDGNIHTYDAFKNYEKEIQNWEDEVELRIITALIVHLSTLERQIKLVPITKTVFGTTTQGTRVFDMKLSCGISGYASFPIINRSEEFSNLLDNAENLFAEITKDSIRHFYSATQEKDRLKQFLNYYMFIERLTHRTFKSINYENHAKQLFSIQDRLNTSAMNYFSKVFSDSKKLTDKFMWCAMTVWDQLDDQDVNCFLLIKKVRDQLAHGEHFDEVGLPVEIAKTLGMKLLGTKQT